MNVTVANILIVEDDTDNVMLYRSMFRYSDIKVVCIHSDDLPRLDDIVAQIQPATIIFDYFSICSYCEMLHDLLKPLSDVPTAVITTSPNRECNALFDYMIAKPFTAENLFDTLSWLSSDSLESICHLLLMIGYNSGTV